MTTDNRESQDAGQAVEMPAPTAEAEPAYLSHQALSAPPYRLRHGFFTRSGGVSEAPYNSLNGGLGSDDCLDNVAENRRRAAAALGCSEHQIASCYQTHSADCFRVTQPYSDPHADRPYADALVTDKAGVLLLLLTADCVPVLFADRTKPIIGAAHAGWRGAVSGILENTLDEMQACGSDAKDIIAVIGPSIHQPSYQIGAEMAEVITQHHIGAETCLITDKSAEDERYLFDLPQFVSQILQHSGVAEIHDMGCDTYAEPDRFFSHRWATHHALKDSGRLISAICIAENKGG